MVAFAAPAAAETRAVMTVGAYVPAPSCIATAPSGRASIRCGTGIAVDLGDATGAAAGSAARLPVRVLRQAASPGADGTLAPEETGAATLLTILY